MPLVPEELHEWVKNTGYVANQKGRTLRQMGKKEVAILESNEGASVGLVELLEWELGAELPSDYKEFLARHNGGRPEPDTYDFGDGGDASDVHRFFGLGLRGVYDIQKKIKVFKGRVPEMFLPIATDSGGNLVCMELTEGKVGTIYFWDHEFEADEEEPDMSNMHFIAPSFSAFLDSLYEFVDDEDDEV